MVYLENFNVGVGISERESIRTRTADNVLDVTVFFSEIPESAFGKMNS
jgi:hypothetical protein